MNLSALLTFIAAAAAAVLAFAVGKPDVLPTWVQIVLVAITGGAAKFSQSPMQPKQISGFPEDE